MNLPEDGSRSGWLAGVRTLDHAGWPALLHEILRSIRHDLVSRLTGINLLQRLSASERGREIVGSGLEEEGDRLAMLARQLEYVVEAPQPGPVPMDPAEVLRGVLLVHSSVARVPFDRHRVTVDRDLPAIRWDRTLLVRSLLLAMDAVAQPGAPLELELGVTAEGKARLRIVGAGAPSSGGGPASSGGEPAPARSLKLGPHRSRLRLLAALYRSHGGYLRVGSRRGCPIMEMELPGGVEVGAAARKTNGHAG